MSTEHRSDAPASLGDPETAENVKALLDVVRYLCEEEGARDQSFNTRAVGLAGFLAIVVSLSATLGREALSSGWGSPWREIGVGLFAGALVALLASVVVVVVVVLHPTQSATLGIAEVERFPLKEYVLRPRVMTEGSVMTGMIEVLALERERGDRKAIGLRWGYTLLVVGLTCISILGFLVGLHEAKLIGARHDKAGQRAALCTQPRGCQRHAR